MKNIIVILSFLVSASSVFAVSTVASGDNIQAAKINEMIARLVPIGSVITMAANCPVGYLEANGAQVSRTTYADLYAVLQNSHGQGNGSSTFHLPDYRGRFLRGVDGSAGNDTDASARTAMNAGGNSGNNVGSIQLDEVGQHTHPFQVRANSANGAGITNPTSAAAGNGGNVNTLANAGLETRPKNAYVKFCIKH